MHAMSWAGAGRSILAFDMSDGEREREPRLLLMMRTKFMATLKRMRSIGSPYFCRNTSNVELRRHRRREERKERDVCTSGSIQVRADRVARLSKCATAYDREQRSSAGEETSGQYLQRAIISRLRSITETKYMFCVFARSGLCYMCRRSSSRDACSLLCETPSFSLRASGNDTQLLCFTGTKSRPLKGKTRPDVRGHYKRIWFSASFILTK